MFLDHQVLSKQLAATLAFACPHPAPSSDPDRTYSSAADRVNVMPAGLRAGLAGEGTLARSDQKRAGRSKGPTRGSRVVRRGGRASWYWAGLARRQGGRAV